MDRLTTGFDPETVPGLLGPDGPAASWLEAYEDRPHQREMALEVARLLAAGGKLAVEAPTGIGKSLAYGLPAALWARHGHGPVVVSTYTKALQDQLLRLEAPRLRKLVGDDLRVELLKGRQNYLCRRRYLLELRTASGPGTRELLERLGPWVENTRTGDLGECGERDPRDLRYLFLKVAGEVQFCAHRDCSPVTGCFFKAARNRAQDAEILVVNHALLAIHLFEGRGVIPEFDALVVDEAHAFVTAALDHLTHEVGPARFAALMERAPFRYLPSWLRDGEGDSRLAALRRAARAVDHAAETTFSDENGKAGSGDDRRRYRDPDELEKLCPAGFQSVIDTLGTLRADVVALAAFVENRVDPADPDVAGFSAALGRFGEEAEAIARDLDDLLHPDPQDRGRVSWREGAAGGTFALKVSPLEVGTSLARALKDGPSRVLFTSATLAAGGDFSFFAREAGLDGDLHALALPSPFDYPEQVAAFAVSDAPDPREAGFARGTAAALHALMEDPGRKTLALFTSYRDLRAVQAALPPEGAGRAYSVFAQGEGESPAELLERFKGTERGLLLGTAGLWQGIDLPGEALEVLVLARLPFGVPTDPRFAARSEAVESAGGNPFTDLYLPEAVLRFKQGFGRLIRRRSDRGLLVVLDPRLLNKSYGKRFLRALPVEVARVSDGAALAGAARAWWRAHAARAAMPDGPRENATEGRTE